MYKKPIRLPSSYMLILCSMHINCQLLNALLKNPIALKVLVWSRGRLVTLQILTSSSFSLVEGTHGSSGQCVSFFLIDVESGITAYVVFPSFYFFLFFGDTGAFYFDNISADDVKLFLLKQTYKSRLILSRSKTGYLSCMDGLASQIKQCTGPFPFLA